MNDKVKEIKERQKNWMRQRASSLDREKERSLSPAGTQKKTLPQSKVTKSTSFRNATPGKEALQTACTYNVHEGKHRQKSNSKQFQQWQRNKTGNKVSKTEQHSDLEGDNVNILKISHDDGTDQENRFGSSSRSSCVSQQTLTPDMFDSLADQIIHRVKKELHVDTNNSSSIPVDYRFNQNVYSSQVVRKEEPTNKNFMSSMDNHHCPNCGQVMLAPLHSPMLIIPCGHSFCKTCVQTTDSCLKCQKVIQSLTCNIMLEQIIGDYNRRQEVGRNVSEGSEKYVADKYISKAYEEVDHTEEYQSLCVRCEAVSMEVEDIESIIETFNQNIDDEKQQIENITSAQERISQEIQNLQTKLTDLERHKDEYNHKINEWAKKREDKRKKLKMTKDMLSQLEKEKNKVKALVESAEDG